MLVEMMQAVNKAMVKDGACFAAELRRIQDAGANAADAGDGNAAGDRVSASDTDDGVGDGAGRDSNTVEDAARTDDVGADGEPMETWAAAGRRPPGYGPRRCHGSGPPRRG